MNADALLQPELVPPSEKKRPTLRERWEAIPRSYLIGCSVGLGGYLVLMALTIGLRPEQFLCCAIMLAACFWNDATRRFATGMLPIIAIGIVYDLTHLTEPYVRFLHVHVEEPYHFDKFFFGIHTADGVLTPNEFFARHHWPIVDFITGTAYIVFLYWAIFFAMFLAATGQSGERRALALRFGWAFFFMHIAGFATYYVYPAAPPWYVTEHGFTVDFSVQANPAACVRWDQFTGIHYFQGFYGRSADVFGAIPSLHVAVPLIVFLYSLTLRSRVWKVLAFAFYLLVCFSAIYLQHHYVLDIAIGSAYALIAFAGEQVITAGYRNRFGAPRPAEPSPTG